MDLWAPKNTQELHVPLQHGSTASPSALLRATAKHKPTSFTHNHNQTRKICEDFFQRFSVGAADCCLCFFVLSRTQLAGTKTDVAMLRSHLGGLERQHARDHHLFRCRYLFLLMGTDVGLSEYFAPRFWFLGTPEEAGAQRKPAHWPVFAARRGQFLCQLPGRRGV